MTCDLHEAEQAVQEQNPTAKKSRRKRECENLAEKPEVWNGCWMSFWSHKSSKWLSTSCFSSSSSTTAKPAPPAAAATTIHHNISPTSCVAYSTWAIHVAASNYCTPTDAHRYFRFAIGDWNIWLQIPMYCSTWVWNIAILDIKSSTQPCPPAA